MSRQVVANRFNAATFDPRSIGVCQLWLRSDKGVTLNGNFVSQWADQSSSGLNFTPQIASAAPQFSGSSGVNGLSKLSFNGISQYLTSSVNLPDTNCTYFIVHQLNNNNAQYQMMISTKDNPGAPGSNGMEICTTPARKRGINAIGINTALDGPMTQNLEMWTVTEQPGGIWSLWVNGQQQQLTPNGFTPSNSSGGTIVGARINGSFFYGGDIYEVIAYGNILNDQQIAAVNAYLQSRYNTTSIPSRGVGFQPTQINGLFSWWRSDQGIQLDSSGSVQSWSDITGNGYNFAQATAANRPGFVKQDPAYNGQPTLVFTAANSTFLNTLAFTLNQPFTLIYVGEQDETTLSHGIVGGQTTTTIGLYTVSTGGQQSMFAGANVSSNVVAASKLVTVGCFNGAGSQLFVNNSVSPTNGNPSTNAIQGGMLVGYANGFANYMQGKVAEVLVFNRQLSQLEVSWLMQYLASRYNPGGWS